MNDCKAVRPQERQTLIQAFERLDHKCVQLKEVATMTEKLNEKLNRIEGHPKCVDDIAKEESVVEMNIVELFNFIADKIDEQINVIGNNTEHSMQMID